MKFPVFIEASIEKAVSSVSVPELVAEVVSLNYFLFKATLDDSSWHKGLEDKIDYIKDCLNTPSKGLFYSTLTENQKSEYIDILKGLIEPSSFNEAIMKLKEFQGIFNNERSEYFVRTRDNVSVMNMKFIYYAEIFSSDDNRDSFFGPVDVRINTTDFLPEKNKVYVHVRATEKYCNLDPFVRFDPVSGKCSYKTDQGDYKTFNYVSALGSGKNEASVINFNGDIVLNQDSCFLLGLETDKDVKSTVLTFETPLFKNKELELETGFTSGMRYNRAVYSSLDRMQLEEKLPVPEVKLISEQGETWDMELPEKVNVSGVEELTPIQIMKLELDSLLGDMIVTSEEQKKIKELYDELKLSTIDYERCYRDAVFKKFFMYLLEKFRFRPVYSSDTITLYYGNAEIFRICMDFGRYYFYFNSGEDMDFGHLPTDEVIGSLSNVYDTKIFLEKVTDLGELFEFIDVLTNEQKSDVSFIADAKESLKKFLPFVNFSNKPLSQNSLENTFDVIAACPETDFIESCTVIPSREDQQVLVKFTSKEKITAFYDRFEMVDGDTDVIVGTLSPCLSEDSSFACLLGKTMRYIKLNNLFKSKDAGGLDAVLDSLVSMLETVTSSLRFSYGKLDFTCKGKDYCVNVIEGSVQVRLPEGDQFKINGKEDVAVLKEKLTRVSEAEESGNTDDREDVFRRSVGKAWDDGVMEAAEMAKLKELRKELGITEEKAKKIGEEVILSLVQSRILNKFPGLKLEKKYIEEKRKYVYSCKVLSQLFFVIEFDLTRGIRFLLRVSSKSAEKFSFGLKPYGPKEKSWFEVSFEQIGKLKAFLQIFYMAYFESIAMKVKPLMEKTGADAKQIAGIVKAKLGFQMPPRIVKDLESI